jgi:ribosomal protein L11 methyltransferase
MVIEARIRLRAGRQGEIELLRCLLMKSGFPPEKIAEKDEKGKLSVSVFLESAAAAQRTAHAVRALKLKNVSVSLVPLKDSDWKTRWKKYFKPFAITRDIRIIPVWEKSESAGRGCAGIRLDTTLAFGTGLHATTKMMAQFIRAHRQGMESFLDVGTGSGILSLIAGRYGAAEIWAIDNDAEAVKTARKNFKRNACPSAHLAAADFVRFSPGRRFDFVAANLFTEDLVRFKGKLASLVRSGGYLAVSGIFAENYPSFVRRFKEKRLRRVAVAHRGKWFAVLFRKKRRGAG